MKRYGIMLGMVLVFFAASAQAANSVDVTGDLARDGNLMIDISWTIDTANYKGDTPAAIHDKVYQDVWRAMRPKLEKKMSGTSVVLDKSNFTKLSEQKQLVEQRADGTKVVVYSAKMKFIGPRVEGASPAPAEKPKKQSIEDLSYRFVREGRDY